MSCSLNLVTHPFYLCSESLWWENLLWLEQADNRFSGGLVLFAQIDRASERSLEVPFLRPFGRDFLLIHPLSKHFSYWHLDLGLVCRLQKHLTIRYTFPPLACFSLLQSCTSHCLEWPHEDCEMDLTEYFEAVYINWGCSGNWIVKFFPPEVVFLKTEVWVHMSTSLWLGYLMECNQANRLRVFRIALFHNFWKLWRTFFDLRSLCVSFFLSSESFFIIKWNQRCLLYNRYQVELALKNVYNAWG